MKDKNITLICGLAVGLGVSHAQTITGFGSVELPTFTQTGSSFSTNTPSATNFLIIGSDFGSTLTGSVSSFTFVGALASYHLNLTGTLVYTGAPIAAPSSLFQIQLYDSAENVAIYQAAWTGFANSTASSVLMTYQSSDPTFDGTVTLISLATSGSGATVNFTLDNLSVQPVPEPATYIVLASIGALGYSLIRRRRTPASPAT
jgi:PEP-CTERM motif